MMKGNIQAHNKVKMLLRYANGDCLDVGCGDGEILRMIAKRLPENSHMAVDYNPHVKEIFERCKENNIRFVLGDINKIKIRKKFDTIILSHVLEHMTDPISCLVNLKKNLKPHGNFIIGVPNKNGFMNTAEGIEEGWGKVSIHYWKFDADSLSFLLKQLGFFYKSVPTSVRIPFSGRVCRRFGFLFGVFYWISTSLTKVFRGKTYELFFIVKYSRRSAA